MLATRKRAVSLDAGGEQKPAPWGQGKSKNARKRARRRAEMALQAVQQEKSKSARTRRAEIALQAAQQGQIQQLAGEERRKENTVPTTTTQEHSDRSPISVTLDFSANVGFQPFGPPTAAPAQGRNPLGLEFGSDSTQAKWESTVRGKGIPSFGQPERQSTTTFNHIPTTSELLRERTIQDIYQENPEKRLRSIEPSTLHLVAQTVQQIADEAANDWHKKTFPGRNWSDSILSDGSDDISSLETVDVDALSSRDYVIAPLLRASKVMVSESTTISMLALCRIMDQCISVCRLVSDDRRHVLLQKAKEKIEWLPVGLDCKKLDIQRQAIKDLDTLHENIRKRNVFTSSADIFHNAEEIKILDRSLVEFQEYRLEFLIDVFQTLKQLLGATA